MQGGTNTSVFGSGGDLITVTNSTGAAITIDDKVYINSLAQTSGETHSLTTSNSRSGYISSDGQYFYLTNSVYHIEQDYSISQTSPLPYYYDQDTLHKNINGYFTNQKSYSYNNDFYMIKNDKVYHLDIVQVSLTPSRGYGGRYYMGPKYVYAFDFDTEQMITFNNSTASSYADNYIAYFFEPYRFLVYYYSSPSYRIDLYKCNTETKTHEIENSFDIDNSTYLGSHFIGLTSDKKYLIITGQANGFAFYELDWENYTAKAVEYDNVIEDMKPYYYNASSGISYLANYNTIDYDPDNEILICWTNSAYSSLSDTDKAIRIFKYLNGEWVRYPFEYPVYNTNYSIEKISFSKGMNRVLINWYQSGYRYLQLTNLTTTTGLKAYTYDNVLMTEATLTGYAKSTAEAEENVEIATVLPPDVDVTVTVTNADNATITMEL